MQIFCKSAMETNQLECRNSLLNNGIEIQLLDDFSTDYKSSAEYILEIGSSLNKIEVIHTPLFETGPTDAVNIEELMKSHIKNTFYNSCELAEIISVKENKNILVIIHTGVNLKDFSWSEQYYRDLLALFKDILLKYPHIRVGIENIMPMTSFTNILFKNGALPDYADLIKDLREKLDTNRIGAVLDTCHAISTCRFFERIFKNEVNYDHITLESFFRNTENVIFLMHLSDIRNLGYTNSEHGISFEESTIPLLEDIIKLYYKYNYKCPITIEVSEKDYYNCKSYIKTRNILENFIKPD